MNRDERDRYSRDFKSYTRRDYHLHHRGGAYRPQQRSEEGRHIERKEQMEAVPKPVGDMCSQACQLFRCGKKALIMKLVNGKPVAYCSWVNDVCIGYKCQYASCVARYLLPNGKCLVATKNIEKNEDEFLKELEKEDNKKSLRSLLSRRGIHKDLGIEDL